MEMRNQLYYNLLLSVVTPNSFAFSAFTVTIAVSIPTRCFVSSGGKTSNLLTHSDRQQMKSRALTGVVSQFGHTRVLGKWVS